jgi:hypothetical protein
MALGYAIGNNKWFLGQVPPNQNQQIKKASWSDSHGDRVKVRIPGMHPMSGNEDSTEVEDSLLPWAIVAKPTTAGNRNFQSSGIWGGEWVIGFFLDEECQIPVITQILGNNDSEYELIDSINGTTLGKRVSSYTGGIVSGPHRLIGAKSPKGLLEISNKEFKDSKFTI